MLRALGLAFSERRHDCVEHGGTSPFGLRKAMPVWVEASVLELPRICINGGRRGSLVGITPVGITLVGITPAVLVSLVGARPVHCALAL